MVAKWSRQSRTPKHRERDRDTHKHTDTHVHVHAGEDRTACSLCRADEHVLVIIANYRKSIALNCMYTNTRARSEHTGWEWKRSSCTQKQQESLMSGRKEVCMTLAHAHTNTNRKDSLGHRVMWCWGSRVGHGWGGWEVGCTKEGAHSWKRTREHMRTVRRSYYAKLQYTGGLRYHSVNIWLAVHFIIVTCVFPAVTC